MASVAVLVAVDILTAAFAKRGILLEGENAWPVASKAATPRAYIILPTVITKTLLY
jgi:hypothetical protein